MSLNALKVEKCKYIPSAKEGSRRPTKLYHERGLYLAIAPSGEKSWRFDFRDPQTRKRQTLTYGTYPELKLKDAEQKHIDARRMLAEGKNPALAKQSAIEIREQMGDNSFRAVSEEWYQAMLKRGPKKGGGKEFSQSWKSNTIRWLKLANAALGRIPMPDIEAHHVLRLIEGIGRKTPASAEYVRQTVAEVFDYGILKLKCPKGLNPAQSLAGAIKVPDKVHRKKLEREQIGPFLVKVKESDLPEDMKLGLQILLHVFTRSRKELLGAQWAEIQGDLWRVPRARMKKGREFWVPLSPQVQQMFSRLRELADGSPYVFPSRKSKDKPRHQRMFNEAMQRIGYGDVFHPHGARATAADILLESGYSPQLVNLQLAHAIGNATEEAYFRTHLLPQRREMMNFFSNFLDSLASGSNVIPYRSAAA